MISSVVNSYFLGAVSFEDRCLLAPKEFNRQGGKSDAVRLVMSTNGIPQLQKNKEVLEAIGLREIVQVDRFNSRSLWEWAWKSSMLATGDIVIDATCLPRELLGMILFALSVRREQLNNVRVLYVKAPPPVEGRGYATQNLLLPEEDRWLSRGIRTIRSIVGYPGEFASERRRHVVALAGHEDERMMAVITSLEPNRLSISSEMEKTSTVQGADEISKNVAEKLRQLIASPRLGTVEFSAESIETTYSKLEILLDVADDENVAIVAMNTKLSFIGAALYALKNRRIRMVCAVPEKYNPRYCIGAGELKEYDITSLIKSATTTLVHQLQEQ